MASVNPAHEELLSKGSFRRAIEVFGADFSTDVKNIGPGAPETVRTQVRYADVLRMAGDYEKAVKMYNEILIKMEALSPDFQDEAFDVKLSLASIYKNDLDEASVLIKGSEQFIARIPLEDSKMALMKKLATTMRDLGRYESALRYFEEIYEFKRNKDPHGFDSLSSHVDIATVYLEQGRYNKAMDILKSIHEEAYNKDPNHSCTLKADRYIADVCVHHGLTLMACMKYERIAQIQAKETPRSLDTLTTLHKLSLAYFKDGRSNKAFGVIEDLYNTRRVETPSHPDTMRVEIDFMMMLLDAGDYLKVASLLTTALERMSDCFEFEYNLIVDVPRNIATFLRKQEQFELAIKIYEFLYQKQCQMVRLGPQHPETLLTRTKIAETHFDQKNPDEALRIFEEVLHIKLDLLRNDSMDCLDVRKHIAKICFSKENYEESFTHYLEVLRNERMYLGTEHAVTVETEIIIDDFSFVDKQRQSDLLKAIIANDLQRVEKICNAPENTDIDAQDDYGCTPLHIAFKAGHPKIVRFLLSKGASLYVKNKSGRMPLELAEEDEVKSISNLILELFEDVKMGNRRDLTEVLSFEDGELLNVLDEEGKTMLHWACERGDVETVKLLVNKGADFRVKGKSGDGEIINVQDEGGRTMLHFECLKGDTETVTFLLNNGADPRVKDKSGLSSLDVATTTNHLDVVKILQRYLEEPSLGDLSLSSPKKGSSNQ